MSGTDDLPLSMEELERIRGELPTSSHETEPMLGHLEALSTAAALSKPLQAASASDTSRQQPA